MTLTPIAIFIIHMLSQRHNNKEAQESFTVYSPLLTRVALKMSLAEPKKKQRIIADPQNKKWAEGISSARGIHFLIE